MVEEVLATWPFETVIVAVGGCDWQTKSWAAVRWRLDGKTTLAERNRRREAAEAQAQAYKERLRQWRADAAPIERQHAAFQDILAELREKKLAAAV